MKRDLDHPGGDDLWCMEGFGGDDDPALDAVLEGAAPLDRDLAPVVEVVQRLRASAAAEPVPPMSAALRARIAAPTVISLTARRAVGSSLRRAAVALAAGAAAAVLVGVGASQNRLPTGVQDAVASTADILGLDVPRSDERSHGDGQWTDASPEPGGDDTAPTGASGDDRDRSGGGAAPAGPSASEQPEVPATAPEHRNGTPGVDQEHPEGDQGGPDADQGDPEEPDGDHGDPGVEPRGPEAKENRPDANQGSPKGGRARPAR